MSNSVSTRTRNTPLGGQAVVDTAWPYGNPSFPASLPAEAHDPANHRGLPAWERVFPLTQPAVDGAVGAGHAEWIEQAPQVGERAGARRGQRGEAAGDASGREGTGLAVRLARPEDVSQGDPGGD